MIETINEQQIEFANKIREYDPSPETDLSSSFPKLDVNLYDDGASFPPLESGLEEVLDPPLTTLLTVAPSFPNTLRNNTAFIMTLFDTPSLLAQSTEFRVSEILGVSASVDEDDTWFELGNIFIEEYGLHETPLGTSCVDLMVAGLANLDFIDNTSPNPLDTFHASPFRSLPSPPPDYRNMLPTNYHDMFEGNMVDCLEPLGNFRECDPSLNPYSLYLDTMPAKVMLTFAFDHSKDFSRAFDKFRRAHTIISRFMCALIPIHLSCMHRCLISSCEF